MTSRETIKLHDRNFRMTIPAAELNAAVDRVAARIAADYAGLPVPLFLGVLNGAFMFTSDLVARMDFPLEVSFVKLASYSGVSSTGRVGELIGLGENIEGRHVVVVEDVVDTGGSMGYLLKRLGEMHPASVEVAAMFFKPGAFRGGFPVKYRGMDIGDEFIVGYGLDYNGLGRNLRDVYVVTE